MKICKKLTFVFMATVLFIGIVGSSVSAQVSPSKINKNNLTQEQIALVQAVSKHLENYTDSEGNKQIKIVNKNELVHKLKKVDTSLNFGQLQSSINKFNRYMADGDNVVKETADDISKEMKDNINEQQGGISTKAFSCGDALTAIGLIHSGSYTAAAYLLGITGPAAVIIPLLVSTVYGIASIACD
ncbi:hypothetical protein [Virgibacillus sp. MG-45]|uniref:hypothetical protein n=1 Tax=Virgibacillus sp. MG-45 TaxID=3102791 RepID=UPI002EDA088C